MVSLYLVLRHMLGYTALFMVYSVMYYMELRSAIISYSLLQILLSRLFIHKMINVYLKHVTSSLLDTCFYGVQS